MMFGHLWHLDAGMGAQLGIPGGSTPAAEFTHHNHRGNKGSLPARGARHSAGLSIWGAGWWLWQAAGVGSPWFSPNLRLKLVGQLWLSFLRSLWPSSFPIEAGESLPDLLGNCTRSSRFARRLCREEPGVGGCSGRACGQRGHGEG